MYNLIRNNDTYPDWHFQPLRLVKSEMAKPMEVMCNFFSAYHLPGARKHFKEMLEDAMCNVEAYAINYLTFYDDVEKLIEAAWLICQKPTIEPIQPAITATGDDSFPAILQLLIGAIRPERIFLLAREGNELIDLLIIVPDRDAKPFRHYDVIISTLFHNITDLSFSLHNISAVQEQLTAASPFYLHALVPTNEVYAATNATPFSIPQPSKEKAEERCHNWHLTEGRANTFFQCAKHSFEAGDLAITLFMLHQAAELSLYGLICTLWGREVKDHSLTTLYRHIRRLHNPELDHLFSSSTSEAKEQLHLLESAYLKSRYNNTFHPTTEQVTTILQWTLDLLDACNLSAHSLLTDSNER